MNSEARQAELIRQLEEKNRRKAQEAREAGERERAAKERVRACVIDQKRICSRLFEPKRKDNPVREEAAAHKASTGLEAIVKRVKQQGPDPRHTAFLNKLAETRRAKEERAHERAAAEKRKRQALAAFVREMGSNQPNDDGEEKSQLNDHEAEKEGKEETNEDSAAAEEGPEADEEEEKSARESLVPSVWRRHKEAMAEDKNAMFDQERNLDRARWSQRHGISEDTPVFICSSGYPAVRDELVRRGWHENKDKDSDIWDMYFTMKMAPFVKRSLRDEQITNRFFGTGEICSKAGISKNLRCAKWFDTVDPDAFFPRCYNLGLVDGSDLEDFIEDFRLTTTERLLKLFRKRCWCATCESARCGCEERPQVSASAFVLQTAVRVCNKYLNRYNDDYVDAPSKFVPPVVSCLDWSLLRDADDETFAAPAELLTSFRQFGSSGNMKRMHKMLELNVERVLLGDEHASPAEREAQALETQRYVAHQVRRMVKADKAGLVDVAPLDEETMTKALDALEALEAARGEQSKINGDPGSNVWIVKPAGKSRGRGIQCFDNLGKLLRYTRASTQETTKWVVQKYMENSLIVHKRKFDIRQWVMVTNWNPLTIYFYDDCYLRFCVEEYSLEDLEDRFIHLANNSVSKHSDKFDSGPIRGNMWRRDDFVAYLDSLPPRAAGGSNSGGRSGQGAWFGKIKPALQDIARLSLSCVQDLVQARANSFEIFGFDFMLDEDLNPWLIEINSSPSMEYSTPITEELTRSALTSAVACVLDGKYKTTPSGKRKIRSQPADVDAAGRWELLYVSPCEFRRKLDATGELNVSGSAIAAYNKGSYAKRNAWKQRQRDRDRARKTETAQKDAAEKDAAAQGESESKAADA